MKDLNAAIASLVIAHNVLHADARDMTNREAHHAANACTVAADQIGDDIKRLRVTRDTLAAAGV